MRSRPAAVAGRFYPAEPRRLAGTVDRLLAAAEPRETGPAPVGLIAPHAGYRYSGVVAAAAYARLDRARPVQRVVVLGPAHFVPLDGCAVPSVEAFETPLGSVPLDVDCCDRLDRLCGVVHDDGPHAPEHAIEVQLPFLQRVLPAGWRLVPIVVGRAEPRVVAEVLEAAAVPGVLVVCSTDLSHYRDHAEAVMQDRRTAAAITSRRADAIGAHDACGAAALRGLLSWGDRRDLAVELLDRRTSGDTTGDRSRVVGYGAFELLDRGQRPHRP